MRHVRLSEAGRSFRRPTAPVLLATLRVRAGWTRRSNRLLRTFGSLQNGRGVRRIDSRPLRFPIAVIRLGVERLPKIERRVANIC